MKILQLHKDYQPLTGGGGTARHIHGLAQALVNLGSEVRVVAPDADESIGTHQSRRAERRDLAAHVAWADVVHVHGARSGYAVWGAALATARGKPFFYTPHAFYEPHGAANRLAKWGWDRTAERFLLTRGAQTVLLTDVWRDWLRARGISTERTSIIPNCILERDMVPPAARDARLPGAPAILSVGRLDPVKRLGDVIAALARPGLERAYLHIVGKGEQRAELERQATETGVGDRVIFHGFVDDAGVAAMMRNADAFALASEQEGLPTVLLEALLARFPVICTRIPGNLAITDVARVDTTYEVGDIDALAALIRSAERSAVSEDAIARLRETFTWEHRAADILSLYSAATAGHA